MGLCERYETKYYENIDFPLISRTATKSFFKRSAYSTMEEKDEWFEEKGRLTLCMNDKKSKGNF